MEPIRLTDVIRATGGEPTSPIVGNPLIEAVTTDSREVPARALFVPIRGHKYDGHVFMEQASVNGASYTLVAEDTDASRIPPNGIVVKDTVRALGDLARWHRSRFDVPVVGITGSCGKTTTKEMAKLVLGDDVVASHASYNNDIGVPLTLLRMDRSTRACIVEIGTNAPGEVAHLAGIARPTVGVLTNVEEAHLEGLGTVRGVMREKAALIDALPARGAAIINADNYYCREIMQDLAARRLDVVSFGTWEDADVYAVEARATDDGFEFFLFGKLAIEVPALGMHNVSNALAAISIGLWLGRDPLAIREALLRYRAPLMRMSREIVGSVLLINDAYNANPRSMDAAICELALRGRRGRRVAVLGEMLELGPQSATFHRALGKKVANEKIDRLWAIGPSAASVAEAAVGMGMPAEHVCWHETMEDAASDPGFEPSSGDTWLFKASRGMALERLAARVRAGAEALHSDTGYRSLSRLDRPRD